MMLRTLNASLKTDRPSFVFTATASFEGALLPCAVAGAAPTTPPSTRAHVTKKPAKKRRVTAGFGSPSPDALALGPPLDVAFPLDDVCAHLVQRVEHRAGRGLQLVERGTVASHRLDESGHQWLGGKAANAPTHLPHPSARSVPNGERRHYAHHPKRDG